ncbi:signal peptide peptidase SppA [Geopsychrobacter electrodiphilus]|uniref:signal peptide peptidase SppA n=1 Tax=Geopsychrobacter electrodiphilus TaxID=225196 RepID=UPI00037C43AA|nr:signal peptide peptidase SppA [Geopsychrobacter electrodiphilus]
MKKRPILLATLTIFGIFLVFLLLAVVLGKNWSTPDIVSLGEKIGVIEVNGPITASDGLIKNLIDFRDNKSIKAVILRIDSPGGAVGPSQEIYSEVVKLQKIKPVVVSMGSVAASGGYYIAAPAKRLFANPGTITGSIGVIMSFPNYEGLMEKVGVSSTVVKSGRFKDIGSNSRPFTPDERILMQALIDDVYSQFVEAVSLGRDIPANKVREIADGRIFSGRQALAVGLIDELGGFQDALAYTAKLTGLEDDPTLIYPEVEQPGLVERILKSALGEIGFEAGHHWTVGPQYLWTGM